MKETFKYIFERNEIHYKRTFDEKGKLGIVVPVLVKKECFNVVDVSKIVWLQINRWSGFYIVEFSLGDFDIIYG